MVLEPDVIDYIDGEFTALEAEPIQRLAPDGQVRADRRAGCWQSMGSIRYKMSSEKISSSGDPSWRLWDGRSQT